MARGLASLLKRHGRRGGRVRARRLSPLRRSEIAARAARARWGSQAAGSPEVRSVRFEAPQWEDPAFLEEILSEGSLGDWKELYDRVSDQPFGPSAAALEGVLSSAEIYGVGPLWEGILRGLRGSAA